MKNFFSAFFASLLALLVFTIVGFLFLIGIAASVSSEEAKTIAANSILVIDLSDNYPEKSNVDPFAELMERGTGKIPSLSNMVALIKNAKKDSSIKGIYIKCQENPNGYASSEEIRNALIDFKTSKKFIIAYGETISQKAYMIASLADQIYTHPQGGLVFNGLSVETLFLKGLIDKLEIEPQIFYAGKFKSATEPFRYTSMSEANRLQTSIWLNGIYDQFINGVAQSRKLEPSFLKAISDQGKIQSAHDALNHKLVDALLYDDQVKQVLAKKIKQPKDQEISFVTIKDYSKAVAIRGSGSGKIAVVYADGDIVMGKNIKEAVASDDYRILFQKLRADKTIDAVVIRINSPGGSALASDIIWREIDLLKKEKPVVVSMGDVAASGGYYIASGADSIFANPSTLTGSIGVFSIVPNIEKFMKNKVGISFDRVNTSTYADAPSATRPLNKMEQQFIQSGVDSVYLTFKSRVAAGRKKSLEYIDTVAQGRVWTGVDAVKVGLVDRIGNLEMAIATSAKMAKLKGYSIKTYPVEKSFIEDLLEGYQDYVKVNAIKSQLDFGQWEVFQELKSIKQMIGNPQARMPIFVVSHK